MRNKFMQFALILMALIGFTTMADARVKIAPREKPSVTVTGNGVHARSGVFEVVFDASNAGHHHGDGRAASQRSSTEGVMVEPRYVVRWNALPDPLSHNRRRPLKAETLYGGGQVWTDGARGFTLWVVPQGGPVITGVEIDYLADPDDLESVFKHGPRAGADRCLALESMNRPDERGRPGMIERVHGVRFTFQNIGQTVHLLVTSYSGSKSSEAVITVNTLPSGNY